MLGTSKLKAYLDMEMLSGTGVATHYLLQSLWWKVDRQCSAKPEQRGERANGAMRHPLKPRKR